MKLKKLKEEAPKYEGKFWSYSKRKFVGYNEWIKEETPCAKAFSLEVDFGFSTIFVFRIYFSASLGTTFSSNKLSAI